MGEIGMMGGRLVFSVFSGCSIVVDERIPKCVNFVVSIASEVSFREKYAIWCSTNAIGSIKEKIVALRKKAMIAQVGSVLAWDKKPV